MGWAAEEIEQVRTLWNDGLSGYQIGVALNKPRNGVLGLIYRLRQKGEPLEARSTAALVSSSKQRSLRQQGKKDGESKKRQREWASDNDPLTEPGEVSNSWLEQHLYRAPGQLDVPFIQNAGCKWPAWSADHESGPCCGLEREAGMPYCEYHQGIGTTPAEPRKRKRRR